MADEAGQNTTEANTEKAPASTTMDSSNVESASVASASVASEISQSDDDSESSRGWSDDSPDTSEDELVLEESSLSSSVHSKSSRVSTKKKVSSKPKKELAPPSDTESVGEKEKPTSKLSQLVDSIDISKASDYQKPGKAPKITPKSGVASIESSHEKERGNKDASHDNMIIEKMPIEDESNDVSNSATDVEGSFRDEDDVFQKGASQDRNGLQYISSNPQQDPYYDQAKDPRINHKSARKQELAIHRAVYPDADDSFVSRRRGDESISFLGSYKKERRVLMSLIVCLGCALVCLSGLVGGILGAALLGGEDDGDIDQQDERGVVPVATPVQSPVVKPEDTPIESPTAPVEPPTNVDATDPVATPSMSPTLSPSTSPIASSSTETSELPTTKPSAIPSLMPIIPSESPSIPYVFPRDTGLLNAVTSSMGSTTTTAINNEGSPQRRAYEWLEKDPFSETLSSRRKIQRFLMVTFYFSTNGDDWFNSDGWLDATDECTWFMSSSPCEGTTWKVIDMQMNRIGGELPRELGLTQLRKLTIVNDANGPYLSGEVPRLNFGVQEVELRGHRFTEPLDSGFFSGMNGLIKFAAGQSRIPGVIPDSISELVSVTDFDLGNSHLSGSIPTGIAQMKSLVSFNISNNLIGGAIPPGISNLTSLVSVDISLNSFSGTIPSSLVTMQSVETYLLNSNLFDGAIPDFGTRSNLQVLRLDDNFMQGAVPDPTCASVTASGASAWADCPDEVTCPCCTHCCLRRSCVEV